MTDAGDVRFKVANFNRENMAKLQAEWDRVGVALSIGARLLASFGFSERTLTAATVLTPIADYLYQRNIDETYLTQGSMQRTASAYMAGLSVACSRPAFGAASTPFSYLCAALSATTGAPHFQLTSCRRRCRCVSTARR